MSRHIQPYARGFQDSYNDSNSSNYILTPNNDWTPYPRTSKAAAINVFNGNPLAANNFINDKRRMSVIDSQYYPNLQTIEQSQRENENHQDESSFDYDERQNSNFDSLFGEPNFYQQKSQNLNLNLNLTNQYSDSSNDFLYPIRTICDDNDLEVSSIVGQSSIRGSGVGSMLGLRGPQKQANLPVEPSLFHSNSYDNGKRKRVSLQKSQSFGASNIMLLQPTECSLSATHSDHQQQFEELHYSKGAADPFTQKILNSLSLAQKHIHEFIEMHQLNEHESKDKSSSSKLVELFSQGQQSRSHNNENQQSNNTNTCITTQKQAQYPQPRKAQYLNSNESSLTQNEEVKILGEILFEIEDKQPEQNIDDIIDMLQNKPTIMYPEKSDGKKREKRNYFQTNFLLKEFEKKEPWNKERLTKISKQCGLTYKQVYKWSWEMKRKAQNANQQFDLFLEASNGIQEF